jgi:hypothetical protein
MSVKSLSEMDSVSLSNLATRLAAGNPCEGRHGTVTSGKHKGRSGRVLKQIKDAYSNDKYSANNILSGVIKRNGYVSLVRFDDGTQAWIKSNYLEVVQLYQAVNSDRCETRGAKIETIAKLYEMMAIVFLRDIEADENYGLYPMSLEVYNFVKMWFPTRQIIINGMHCGSVLECAIKPVSKPKLKAHH